MEIDRIKKQEMVRDRNEARKTRIGGEEEKNRN